MNMSKTQEVWVKRKITGIKIKTLIFKNIFKFYLFMYEVVT